VATSENVFVDNKEFEFNPAVSVVFFPLTKKAVANTKQMMLNVDAATIDQLDFDGGLWEISSGLRADSSKRLVLSDCSSK
jgi:hypothetical protein